MRIIKGKLEMMERDVEHIIHDVNRIKAWITGIKGMIDRFNDKEEAMKPIALLLRDDPGLTTISACCSNPPGDGSTCAGGTCCCGPDYVCDKCKSEKLKVKACDCTETYVCESCLSKADIKN